MVKKYNISISASLLFLLLGAANFTHAQPKKFIDRSDMDLSIKPGDDFYHYAGGNWIKNNPVPAKGGIL